jgi:hypothetical protein
MPTLAEIAAARVLTCGPALSREELLALAVTLSLAATLAAKRAALGVGA